jgi:hypothetical protein
MAVTSAVLAGNNLPPEKSSGTHFCQRLSKPGAIVRLEGLGKLKKKNQ